MHLSNSSKMQASAGQTGPVWIHQILSETENSVRTGGGLRYLKPLGNSLCVRFN